MWATEFGQNQLDEVNLIQAGQNYGWPVIEGNGDTANGKYTNPLVTWRTSEASPSGAAIINDTLYVAALRGERIWRIALDGTTAGKPTPILDTYGRIRTVSATPDDKLLFTTSNRDGRGTVREGDDRVILYQP